jgi:Mg-chelatase subunit ChlD
MNNLPTNPLTSFLKKAATTLPVKSGEVQVFRDRVDRSGPAVVLICDTSGSMAEPAGGRLKIDHLHEALDLLSKDFTHGIAFNSVATLFSPGSASRFVPSGGTDLTSALELAATLSPRRTIVISDGQPNNGNSALDAARKLTGIIDCIFCGPDSDRAALGFLQTLARCGCGQMRTVRLSAIGHAPLVSVVRGLIGGGT